MKVTVIRTRKNKPPSTPPTVAPMLFVVGKLIGELGELGEIIGAREVVVILTFWRLEESLSMD